MMAAPVRAGIRVARRMALVVAVLCAIALIFGCHATERNNLIFWRRHGSAPTLDTLTIGNTLVEFERMSPALPENCTGPEMGYVYQPDTSCRCAFCNYAMWWPMDATESITWPDGRTWSVVRLKMDFGAAALVIFAALFSMPDVLALVRRRRTPGLCRKCGYDLRATPARCPECGLASPDPPDVHR